MELTPQRGALPVTVDTSRKLFFGMNAAWLIQQRFGPNWMQELFTLGKGKDPELKSAEALQFFLWAGLQDDAAERREPFTLDQAKAALTPFTLQPLFTQVTTALMLGVVTPVQLGTNAGKAEATGAAAKPAAAKGPGPTRVSTSMKRSGSPLRSLAGGRRSSGARR